MQIRNRRRRDRQRIRRSMGRISAAFSRRHKLESAVKTIAARMRLLKLTDDDLRELRRLESVFMVRYRRRSKRPMDGSTFMSYAGNDREHEYIYLSRVRGNEVGLPELGFAYVGDRWEPIV